MDFSFREEQQLFSDSVRQYARKELAQGVLERANAKEFPWEVSRKLAQFGLLGLTISEEDGGVGATLVDAIIAIQGIASVCPRSADVVQAGNFGAIRTFAQYANSRQKEKFLPSLLAGESIMAVGMTEPDAGSAVTDLRTRATIDGDHCFVNGSKVYGTHSGEAGVFLVYVRFAPGVGGIGSVLIEKGTSGFEIGPPTAFMNGEHWCPLYFNDCRIPVENVLLGEGGFKKQIAGFNIERLGNAARSVALGRHAYEVARDYALNRQQFGRALCEFQGLQWKFAEMALQLESAQLLLMRAAVNADKGLPSAYETSMAKLACNQAGFHAANEALQVMGAAGLSEDNIVQYCVRRTRAWMIAGGSVEILKNRIAEGIFDRRFSQRPHPGVNIKSDGSNA